MSIRLAIATVLLCAGSVAAQYAPGDILVCGKNPSPSVTWPLIRITPGGTVSTATTGLPVSALAIAVAPDNRSVVVSGVGNGNYVVATVAPDGTITNLVVDQRRLFSAIDVDGAGNLIMANLAGSEVFSFANNTLSTVYSGMPVRDAQVGALDPATGDMIVVQSNGIFRLTLGATPQGTTIAAIPQRFAGGALRPDLATGDMIGAWGTSVYRVSLSGPNALTTLLSIGVAEGIERDSSRDLFVVSRGLNLITRPEVFQYDAATNVVTSLVPLSPSVVPGRCTIAGSRHLAGMNTPTLGSTYQLRVSSPNEPGATYFIAASFGTSGITLAPGKTVYLSPDGLYRYSLTNSGIFSNFRGSLDAQGEQIASMTIPTIPALRGVRFFTAAVTIAGGTFSAISDPVGVTIQ